MHQFKIYKVIINNALQFKVLNVCYVMIINYILVLMKPLVLLIVKVILLFSIFNYFI